LQSFAVSLTACWACFFVPRTGPCRLCGPSPPKIAGGFQLRERLTQVNDVNAVARVEDEGLHLGIPTSRLVSEMDARFQQFLYADAEHNFPLVESLPGQTIPRNTGLISMFYGHLNPHGNGKFKAVSSYARLSPGEGGTTK